MDRLRFGTGGSPFSSQKRSTLSGIERIAELGLECLEVEFVHGVKMSAEEAARIRERSAALDVKLSAHGPYYINLASLEKQKIGASRAMLLQTAKACQAMGADRFTFHPAFYQQRSSEEVYPIVKEQLQLLRTSLLENGITA
ncbi:MAG TPA: TIM barrel protein, partial [bacterium]|nr:TIM barrel protein [bacterium]